MDAVYRRHHAGRGWLKGPYLPVILSPGAFRAGVEGPLHLPENLLCCCPRYTTPGSQDGCR